jgi:hypothetical protein
MMSNGIKQIHLILLTSLPSLCPYYQISSTFYPQARNMSRKKLPPCDPDSIVR